MTAIIAAIISGLLILTLCILFLISPGKPEPYTDIDGRTLAGSISEKTFLTIGGVRQGMIIKSKNPENPVLLYVHGGPAFPNYFLIDKYKPGLEDYFTVCYWERRGGGISFSPEVSPESMNFNQLTSDAVEVSNYLRKRFGKDKIYIMAHSGGTPVALRAVYRNPELFEAYIAMAQITDQKESEKKAFKYMMNYYSQTGNEKRLKKMQEFIVSESEQDIVLFYKSALRDQSMHELGIGTMRELKSVIKDIFIPVWTCRAYTLSEKWNTWKSKFKFLPKTNLVNELFEINFFEEIAELGIPVYFLSGKYDLTVNVDLARSYFSKLNAPIKAFYTFDNSAHSPLFEEAEKVRRIFETDILRAGDSLAD